MRVPDRAYWFIERVYMNQRRIRYAESQRRMEAEDQALRAWSDRMSVAHDRGACGGREGGCPFVPCFPPVDT